MGVASGCGCKEVYSYYLFLLLLYQLFCSLKKFFFFLNSFFLFFGCRIFATERARSKTRVSCLRLILLPKYLMVTIFSGYLI